MYKVIIFIFLCSIQNLYSQEHWNLDSLKNLAIDYLDTTFVVNSISIRYQEYSVPDSNYRHGGSYFIRISIVDNNDFIMQIIDVESFANGSPIDSENAYNILAHRGITLDYNFDGFEDIALRISNGYDHHAVNGLLVIYLFNPETNTFYEYKDAFINPIPYPDENIVKSYSRISAVNDHFCLVTYKWKDDILEETEIIEYELLDMYSKDKDIIYKVTKSIIQEGKVIKSEILNLKESEMNFKLN